MRLYIFIIITIILAGCKNENDEAAFYMPAEWEPHEAVWFGWEDRDSSFHPIVANIIRELMPTVQVKIAVDNDSLLRVCKAYLLTASIDTAEIDFHIMKGDRYWIRDHGAAFLVNKKGELAVADFDWSLYGIEDWYNQYYNHNKDSVRKRLNKYFDHNTGKVDSLMAVAEKARIIKSGIINEGGAIEVNGKGTLILCEAVTLQRNPGKTREQLEKDFKKALGIKKIIWLKQGLVEDAHIQQLHYSKYMTMGTGGHTDEFVRFVNANTILLAWVDEAEIGDHPFNRENHKRMSENLKLLEAATDQDGKPFTIIKMLLPAPVERKVLVKEVLDKNDSINVTPSFFIAKDRPKVGDTLVNVAASSYLNYVVSNGVVLLPAYTGAGVSNEKEKKVKEIFQTYYPDRRVVFLPSMPLNWNGGGFHCSTQQQPKRIIKE